MTVGEGNGALVALEMTTGKLTWTGLFGSTKLKALPMLTVRPPSSTIVTLPTPRPPGARLSPTREVGALKPTVNELLRWGAKVLCPWTVTVVKVCQAGRLTVKLCNGIMLPPPPRV